MRELLEKWAALEPRWCQVDDERATVMADVGTPIEHPRFTAQFHRLGQYEPDILAATIEAVEARDRDGREKNAREEGEELFYEWHWRLFGDSRAARAIVWRGWPETVGRDYAAAADTPADALLSAYLAALEAEGP